MMRHRLTRRLITLPAVFLAAAIVLALTPLAVPVAVIHDLFGARPRRFQWTRVFLFGLGYVLCEVAAIIAALVLWIVCGFGFAVRTSWGQRLHSAVQARWIRSIAGLMSRLLGLRVEMTGDAVDLDGAIILLARHSSIADPLLPALALVDSNKALRYVMKRELLVVPALDLFGHRLPNHFVDRSGTNTPAELAHIRELAAGMTASDAAVIFPEGTRFSPAKRERAIERVASTHPDRADRLRQMTNVMPPRPGGTRALMEGSPEANLGLFLHFGLERYSKVSDILANVPIQMPVTTEVRLFLRSEVETAGDIGEWLDAKWEDVDAWVADMANRADDRPTK